MSNLEYEIDILEREKIILGKRHEQLTNLVESQHPYQRYFEILEEIKKVQGTDEIFSVRIKTIINEGAKLEKNLVKINNKHSDDRDKAREELFEINEKLSFVNNNLACLLMRNKKGE